MAIPDYQAFMAPLLGLASDGSEHAIRDAYEVMARHFGLTDEALDRLIRAYLGPDLLHWADASPASPQKPRPE